MNYKEYIKELGITVKFLAKKIGVSQTMMSYYVNNTRPIPFEIERDINRVLKAVENIAQYFFLKTVLKL